MTVVFVQRKFSDILRCMAVCRRCSANCTSQTTKACIADRLFSAVWAYCYPRYDHTYSSHFVFCWSFFRLFRRLISEVACPIGSPSNIIATGGSQIWFPPFKIWWSKNIEFRQLCEIGLIVRKIVSFLKTIRRAGEMRCDHATFCPV